MQGDKCEVKERREGGEETMRGFKSMSTKYDRREQAGMVTKKKWKRTEK